MISNSMRIKLVNDIREAGESIDRVDESLASYALKVYLILNEIFCNEELKAGHGLFDSIANLIESNHEHEIDFEGLLSVAELLEDRAKSGDQVPSVWLEIAAERIKQAL